MNDDDDNEEILPESGGKDWWVRTSGGGLNKKTGLARECTHSLIYKGHVQNSAKGLSGLNAMRKQAEFMNERGLKPQEEVKCLGDISGEAGRSRAAKKWKNSAA